MRIRILFPILPRLIRIRCALLVAGLLITMIAPSVGAAADSADSGSLARRRWASRYNGPTNGSESANALSVSPKGTTVFVTGASSGGSTDDYATVAYDAVTGAELWVSGYNGPGNEDDSAYALGVSPDGGKVFVTGASAGEAAFDDYATVAYDAVTGVQLWATRYNGSGNDRDYAVALGVSPDGGKVFVTGSASSEVITLSLLNTWDAGSRYDYATVGYDAATGAQLWVSLYDPDFSPSTSDQASALQVSPDGSKVFVTGYSGSGYKHTPRYTTIAYDSATGARLWARDYSGPGEYDYAHALGVSSDSSTVFVTGHSDGGASDDDYATVAYDAATGEERWVIRYNGPVNGSDVANALGVSRDGSIVFVTGYSDGGASDVDYATVAYDAATGAELWVVRFNGRGNGDDASNALGVAADGSTVFVTGSSYRGAGGDDYVTVAYDAVTGARLWISRARGKGDDIARALGVSPSGSVAYVTGSKQAKPDGSTDYGTIAYVT